MILYELETGNVPFAEQDDEGIRNILLEQKLRPLIPESTDKNLSLLIRRCWQDNHLKRPDFRKILKYLDTVQFSQ